MSSVAVLNAFDKAFAKLTQHSSQSTLSGLAQKSNSSRIERFLVSRPLIIFREDYQSGYVGSLVDRLMDFSDDHSLCDINFGAFELKIVGASVPFVCQGAVDEQIRTYFKEVSVYWPYWFHFLKPNSTNAASLLHLIFDTKELRFFGKQARSQLLMCESGFVEIQRLAIATSTLHAQMGFDSLKTQQLGWAFKNSVCEILRQDLSS